MTNIHPSHIKDETIHQISIPYSPFVAVKTQYISFVFAQLLIVHWNCGYGSGQNWLIQKTMSFWAPLSFDEASCWEIPENGQLDRTILKWFVIPFPGSSSDSFQILNGSAWSLENFGESHCLTMTFSLYPIMYPVSLQLSWLSWVLAYFIPTPFILLIPRLFGTFHNIFQHVTRLFGLRIDDFILSDS